MSPHSHEMETAKYRLVPLRPVFHTVFVYLSPVTILLVTRNENFRLYLLPSFSVNHGLWGFPPSGIGRTISGLPGDLISRLKIFTSGSRDSTILKQWIKCQNFCRNTSYIVIKT